MIKFGQKHIFGENYHDVIEPLIMLVCVNDYYKSYPLFEYIKEITDEFWPESYPSEFAKRLSSDRITNYRLDEYLIAATEEQHFKHTSFYKLYRNEIDATSPEREVSYSGEIAATLKAYGLDISKFWYLCLMIRDYVEGQTKKGCLILEVTHRKEIRDFISQLEQLKPDNYLDFTSTPNDIEVELCLKIKKKGSKYAKNITVTKHSHTLLLIQEALESFLKSNTKRDLKLDVPAISFKQVEVLKDDLGLPTKVSLFYRYLMWFLKKREVDKEFVNNYGIFSVSTSRNLLATRMAYFTGLTDNRNFLEKDGSYIRTYISSYEDVKVNTINHYYDIDFKTLLELRKKM